MTVMLLSTFVTGFVVAYVRNWRLALVVSTISQFLRLLRRTSADSVL